MKKSTYWYAFIQWLRNLISNSDDASHKRLISLMSWGVLLVILVLDACGIKISDKLIYVFAALTFGQSALTVIDKFFK